MNKSNPNYIEKKIKTIKFNQTRHQFKNSECGVYSINFILRLLKGETFEFICDNITIKKMDQEEIEIEVMGEDTDLNEIIKNPKFMEKSIQGLTKLMLEKMED